MTHTPPKFAIAGSTAAVETAQSLSTVYLENIELLLDLNLKTARDATEAFSAASKTIAAATTPLELQNVASGLSQPLWERSLTYSRRAYEIIANTNQQMSKVIIGQISNTQLTAGVPESWTALVEAFSKNVQQFSAIAASNVAAVSEASISAVDAVATRARKAA